MNNMLATPIQLARNLHVTPLIDIHNAAFAHYYRDGLWWSLYGDYEGDKPLPDDYLVENIKRDVSKGMFDGGILDPHTGQLRPDVVALVTFTHPNTTRGYAVARRDHFYYTDAESRIQTESALTKELYDTALDMMSYPDEANSWYYAIGCLLGGLSIRLFPATSREWQQWEAEHSAIAVVK